MEKKQVTELKRLTEKRNTFMKMVKVPDAKINELLANIQVKPSVEKKDCPEPGSGPYKLCKVLSSKPKTKEEIAKKTGLSVSTVTLYLQNFNCFESTGRGKGYIYKKPAKEKTEK